MLNITVCKVFSRSSPARFAGALVACGLLSVSSCGGDAPLAPPGELPPPEVTEPPARTLSRIRIDPSSISLPFIGSELHLHAQGLDQFGYALTGVSFEWSAEDSAVVQLRRRDHRSAAARALSMGSTEITVRSGDHTTTAPLTVESAVVLQNECMECHWTMNPGGHFSWGFTLDRCGFCHDTSPEGHGTIWEDHAAASGGFRVEPPHAGVPCVNCHVAGSTATIFEPADDQDCAACHVGDYQRVHQGTGFAHTCLDCHDGLTWQGATFEHPAAFPLLGPHTTVGCESCHGSGGVLQTVTPAGTDDCAACHQDDYDRVHSGTTFPQTCLDCHDGQSWLGAFDHQAVFPLLGPHIVTLCESCHGLGGILETATPAGPDDCAACHSVDYELVHTGTSFPRTCLDCHDGQSWQGASFDHQLVFPLRDIHASLSCGSCHVPGGVVETANPAGPSDCAACHAADYDRAHAGTPFPRSCLDCHDGQTWRGPSFDHDRDIFPIYSGTHADRWSECGDCHTVGGGGPASCLTCHSGQDTAADHSSVQGFQFSTPACLSCHPTGNA